ncbi:hypothetical protein QBC40DRAFT_270361 [Triangularia verruculosa]|uniref:Nephrocystin 3-like N-terminal domain-containing protein n=1 Tax=Triangularia verruculosa TaxID=2587418 RepID=A0AAN6X6V8_9PEZI|nr:hypothetical protein QBC40DRAFT_270361 [Triangularia verruculosa]
MVGSVSVNKEAGRVPFKDREVAEATARSLEKAACLRSLGFCDIDARLHDIAAAYRGTCDWLFSTTQFQKWRDRADLPDHNGVLWIKGKPGAGKSTLMKYALRHCKVFANHLIVADTPHFFNTRGEILEKTPLGMLRSIVYQLLEKDNTLYERFRSLYKKQRMYKEGEWPKPLLLINVLDEYDERDVRDIVDFLKSLSIDTVQTGITLRIYLSSRHYPNGGHFGNALQAASYRGNSEIVQQLLEYGADVNAQGGEYGNALQATSTGGHAEIVRQLLERGADVNV